MAKITIGADIKQVKQKFKRGDLVMLMDGKHQDDRYRNRPMIVSEDENLGYFTAFCLIDNQELHRCAASQFELSTKHILISN